MKTKSVRRVLSFINFEVSGNPRLNPRLRKRVYPLFELTRPASISRRSATRNRRPATSVTLARDQREFAASKTVQSFQNRATEAIIGIAVRLFPVFPP